METLVLGSPPLLVPSIRNYAPLVLQTARFNQSIGCAPDQDFDDRAGP